MLWLLLSSTVCLRANPIAHKIAVFSSSLNQIIRYKDENKATVKSDGTVKPCKSLVKQFFALVLVVEARRLIPAAAICVTLSQLDALS